MSSEVPHGAGRTPAASRPLNRSKMMQASSATAQSFQEPNHSRFGVPWTSQTMSQIKLAMPRQAATGRRRA
jgi:hypothetical protein